MNIRTIVFFFVVFARIPLMAQMPEYDPKSLDYSSVDTIALHFPKENYKSYTELVAPLTAGLQTDEEKLRVLFRWITDNVAYSMGNRSADADKVVKKGKAVCIGYASLLKAMCTSAGVECVVITGYAKSGIDDIGKKYEKTDHAWNAVKLNGKWYLLDVTWASSAKNADTKRTIKRFDEYWFLTPPEEFIRSHFPKDKQWQFLDEPIKKSEFSKTHIYYPGYYDLNITDLNPHKGLLKARMNDSLEFSFKSSRDLKKAVVFIGNDRFIASHALKKEGDVYTFKQHIEMPGNYRLILMIDEQQIAVYKLVVGK